MGTAVWHPKWWTKEQHESNWDRVKEALRRDWERTKVDLAGHGRDLDQDVGDTVKQAAGKEPIPPRGVPNASWDDVEEPLRYGVGARQQFGRDHAKWNDNLEGTLKTEWESTKGDGHRAWNDVRNYVRHGYERIMH